VLQFRVEMMDSFVKLAKYRYECGNYSVSTSYLYFYMLIMPPTDKVLPIFNAWKLSIKKICIYKIILIFIHLPNFQNYLNVLWGKLASEILVQNWETALEDVNKLREYIDSNVIGNSLQVLQQRTWLIHWSLFVFFNHVKGRDLIIEMFLYRPQ